MRDLVMIPAFGCDRRLYDEVAEAIVDLVRPRIIIADCPSFEECVQQVLEQSPDRFMVLGTSFGGRVALETTLAAPDRVEGLVVIGAGPEPVADPAAGRRRAERLRAGDMEGVLADMGSMVSHLPGPRGPRARNLFIAMAHDMGWERMARQADALAVRGDLRPRLHKIACPSLMLWGEHDQFSPAKDGLALSMAISGARYVEIAGCGHFPTLEAPAETTAALRHWLVDSRLT
jgi:pimeloyl-ACP methyl ester carboxylesterase